MNEFGFVADNEINDNFGFVADVEEVKTQPIKQQKPVVQPKKQEIIEQPTQMLTGGVEQKVIPNWDSKGRVYYTDEQGNRIKSNVPLSRKIGNKIKATATNVGDWLTTDVGENAKQRRKAVAMGVITLADLALNQGRGLLSHAVGGGVGSGLYSLADQAIEGEFNPKQLAIDTGLGAGLGASGKLLIDKAIQPIAKNISRRTNIAKRRATPLAERMTAEQLERATAPAPVSQYGVKQIDTAQNKAIAKQIQDNISAEESLLKEYKTVRADLVKKYGSVENLKAQAVKDLPNETQYGMVSDAIKDYRSLIAYEQELGNAKYVSTNIKPTSTREGVIVDNVSKATKQQPVEKVAQQPQTVQQVDNVIPEQVVEATPEQVSGDIKKRSLQQSVLEAKGTPKEVKEAIKENPATYEVLKNKDLTAQASKELEGNFDNELVRLASAKDFDALDYEKSHQIARQLFGMGDYKRAVDLIDNVSENATKKGQAIQALSLWSNMTPEGAVYKAQKLLKEYNKKHPKKPIELTDENVKTIANLQKEALNTTDELTKKQALSKSMKYISELVPKNALQKLKAYRNIAMLLNPKTLMRNTVGNALFNTIDTASKGLASGIDTLMSLKTGQKTRVAPDLKTYGKGLVEGAKTGYKEALQGIDTRGLGQRFDLGSGRTFQSKPMRALETALDVGLRVPDRAFYEATFAESVENMMKAQGLKEPTQEILEQAEQEALESVFQNQSVVSGFATGLRDALSLRGSVRSKLPEGVKDFLDKYKLSEFGLGDVLIPYAQTPANLTQQAINYSPLGAVKGLANLVQGNQRQASLDLARSLIGSGLIGGGYGLAKAGLTTPSQFDENYQKNKTIRENLQPLGIRPDQLGNMWYAPFQPMSSPIAVGTAMAYNENPLYAGLNTVVDQPYLQGVTRGLRDIQEGDWAKAGTNVLASIPSQFTPTAFSQIAQTIDPYQRETYDPNKLKYGFNSAIAKVPFASKTLPEKVDVTGQPIERYKTEGARKLFDIFLNPTFINKKTTDPVLSELKYIYDQTKETSHFMPSVDKKLKFKDVDGNQQEIELTGREFSEYQKRLGQRMYEEFDYVMDLPKYTNADEYGKIKLLEKAKKLVKDEVDNEMWNKKKAYKKSSYTKGN
jgi:hypothetical protein